MVYNLRGLGDSKDKVGYCGPRGPGREPLRRPNPTGGVLTSTSTMSAARGKFPRPPEKRPDGAKARS